MLICIYVGAIYGGSRSAILLNIPGTPASACSTLDGYPLARQGLAGRAMGISTSGSWLGTLFGILCVAALTPVLSEVALKFQSFEFFWIAVFGIVIAGTLSGGDPLKGYIAGFLGLFIATIGQEPYYNYQRFAFGSRRSGGRHRPAAGAGRRIRRGGGAAVDARAGRQGHQQQDRQRHPGLEDVTKYWRTILRSGAIGTFIGILPGLGEDTAAWSSYAAARRASKEKEKLRQEARSRA